MKKYAATRKLTELLNSRYRRPLIIVLAFVVIGVIILISTRAQTPSASLEAENGSRNGGSIVGDSGASGNSAIRFGTSATANGINKRFFADDASWNRPVSDFGRSTALDGYADRFWNYAGLPANPGDTNVDFKDYSVPIYDAARATTTARIFQVTWSQNQQTFSTSGVAIGTTIPWNPTWKPGTGNDRIMQIVDYTTGRVYGLWVVGETEANGGVTANIGCDDHNILGIAAFDGPNTKAGFVVNNQSHLCLASANTYTNLYTAKDGSTNNDRGMGINKLALVTRAAEVQSGTIRHALELTITSTMFGAPNCSPTSGTSAVGAGTDCGFYLPPATRVEFGTNENNRINNRCTIPTQVNSTGRAQTIPEGIRVALDISDNDITNWLDDRGYTGAKRTTARVFATALRDYGAIVAETGCYGIGIETDGLINPASKTTWESLGITDISGNNNPHGDLLDGLMTRQRLYVVNPPN